jgi:ATP-dependent Clp protease ATP-binding subunit ClpA
MFERFTRASRDAVTHAQIEARELQHPRIGTEHLLLALLADQNGSVATMLRDDGVDHASVRAGITRHVTQRPAAPAESPAETDAADAAALRAIGIDIEAVRRAIEENFGPEALQLPPPEAPRRRGFLRRSAPAGAPNRRHIPFSDRAKKTLELALREALRLKHNFIAPEHILLGIVREGGGLGARILVDAGVDLDNLRTRTVNALKHPAA